MTPKAAAAVKPDGETRTSRIVGSVDFVRPTLPSTVDDDNLDKNTKLHEIKGVRCAMPFTIKCVESSITTDEMMSIANDVFDVVEDKLSTYNPYSEISIINDMSAPTTADGVGNGNGAQSHKMSKPLREVVLTAKEMVKMTRGAFDPAIAPILRHYESQAAGKSSRSGSVVTSQPPSPSTKASEEKKDGDVAADGANKKEDENAALATSSSFVDADTLRRQRAVVDVMQGLLSRGFAADPSDTRISKKVAQLLQISQWSNAFSVGRYNHDGSKKSWRSTSQGRTDSTSMHDDGKDDEEEEVYIRKKANDALLDLSGIAKGWAVDELTSRLPSPCYVEWGGDVKVRGQHPSGRKWIVAIPEPPSLSDIRRKVEKAKKEGQVGPVFALAQTSDDDDNTGNGGDEGSKKTKQQQQQQYLAILELNDGDAVATSGDCEKVIERSSKLYSNIVNPHLGRLLELNQATLAQAVVVCSSCMIADALSTAAISKEDVALARTMLDNFRTGYKQPVKDFLLYARNGPRIVRMTVPGIEPKSIREQRLTLHQPGAKVIVIGSGLAGMSAAITAADAGASVLLLEKESKLGGNSAKATSGINGWGTVHQARSQVADDERWFERDTFRSGKGGKCTPSLVRTLSTQSAPAIHWLTDRFKIPLSVLSQLGGHSTKRTHRAPPDENGRPVPIGYLITKTLRESIEREYHGKIEVRTNQTVTKLLHTIDNESRIKTVTGVQVNGDSSAEEEEVVIHADSVVLATGGFGCCQSSEGLMARFRPDLLGLPTTNGAFAKGDGVLLGEEVGAELVDMDKVQLHPTGFIDPKDPSNPTKFLAPEAIRGSGGILINSDGKRFVNELDLRSVVAAAIQKYGKPYRSGNDYVGPPFAWVILSQEAQRLFGPPVLAFYKDRLGLFEDCEDVKAAAALIGCTEQSLEETLREYVNAVETGHCMATHKDVFPSSISPESKGLVLARITPSIHYTMGGLNINAAGEVQERIYSTVGHHRHIRGLYAAGEVTGGVHGNNRLGGNSLLECVVFGRIAGERAATVRMPEPVMFPKAKEDDGKSEKEWFPVVLREIRNTDEKYGINTREVRFNLHGALQNSGLDVGQFVALRGELDGETLMGYFSPITRPSDEGVIGILCRVDAKGGPITRLLTHIRPGSVVHMCPMGGLRLKFQKDQIFYKGQPIKRIGLLAGGTGIAPMLQIIRAYGQHVRQNGLMVPPHGLHLIYAAEEESDLAFMKMLQNVRDDFPEHFRYYVTLNRPPIGWTEGVGFVEPYDIKRHLVYPPQTGDIVVMCGPPVFEAAMRKSLQRLGFDQSQWFSFSADDNVSAHL